MNTNIFRHTIAPSVTPVAAGSSPRRSPRAIAAVATLAGAAAITLTVGVAPHLAGADTATARPQYVGAAALGGAHYALPANAIYVSPRGDDSGSGSIDDPKQTIAAAVAKRTPGFSDSTIVLRSGTYHENVTLFARQQNVTIEAYPGDVVWMDGSVPVDDWSQSSPGVWVHSGWTAQFDNTPGYDANSAARYNWLTPEAPMAAHPDQVFMDGHQMTQVGSLDEVVPGAFYVDYDTDQLYVGSDPNGHTMRASDLAEALTSYGPGTILRGFGIRRYATPVSALGTLDLASDNSRLANMVVTDNASQGIRLRGTGITAYRVTSQDNGLNGINANISDDLRILNSVVTGNNDQHFNYAPVAAGIKVTSSQRVIIANSTVSDNFGNGIWFDTSCYRAAVLHDTISNNAHGGVYFELSSIGTVAGSTITDSGTAGIHIADTDQVAIWNNTISGSKTRDIEAVQDSRKNTSTASGHDPRHGKVSSISWITSDILIKNNILDGYGQYHVFVQDTTGQRTADQMGVEVDRNQFALPAQRGYSPFGWGIAHKGVARYFSIDEFVAATQQGQLNTMAPDSPTVESVPRPIADRLGGDPTRAGAY